MRWPQPRKRMSQTDPDGPRPRPAQLLGTLCFQSRLEPGALLSRAEVVMMATERSHRAPVTGSPSELMGAGNCGPGPPNCPGLRLRGLTAAGARTVSMTTGFSLRGPQQWGCPAAPVWYDVLSEGSVGGLGLVGTAWRLGN